jgi:predicted TIM-barrel fold metal-dependent hydrolase
MDSARRVDPMRTLLAAVLLISVTGHSQTTPVAEPTGTDCHMHVTPQPESEFIPQDADRVQSALDGAGLLRGCILSPGFNSPKGCHDADCPGQRDWTQTSNDWTLAQARKNKNLLPFCGIPIHVPWSKEEVRRCAAGGARGLKLHPVAEGLSLTDPKAYNGLEKIARAAAKYKLPILIHIPFTDEDAAAFFKLAADNPKTTFILAHQLGPKIALIPKAPPNVYIDISGLVLVPRSAGPRFVAWWRAVGMKRILLASDWPLLHPSEYMAALRAFPLTDEERRMIITDNAQRLLPSRKN